MEQVLKEEVRKEISRIVDLMIQADSIRESIAQLKKDIKKIVNLIDSSLSNSSDDSKLRSIADEVVDFMKNRPLFKV